MNSLKNNFAFLSFLALALMTGFLILSHLKGSASLEAYCVPLPEPEAPSSIGGAYVHILRFQNLPDHSSVDTNYNSRDWVCTATSWQSKFDWDEEHGQTVHIWTYIDDSDPDGTWHVMGDMPENASRVNADVVCFYKSLNGVEITDQRGGDYHHNSADGT